MSSLTVYESRVMYLSITCCSRRNVLDTIRRLVADKKLPSTVAWSRGMLALLFLAHRVDVPVLQAFAEHNVYPCDWSFRIYLNWIGRVEAISAALHECGALERETDPIPRAFEQFRWKFPSTFADLLVHMVAPNRLFSLELIECLRSNDRNDIFVEPEELLKRVLWHNARVRFEEARAAGYENPLTDFLYSNC